MSPNTEKPVLIRQVWAENLEMEFEKIGKILVRYPLISMDTEFPGVIMEKGGNPYQCMKKNVNALNLIQVGLTFSDSAGNLPDLGTDSCFIWEFNFRDFDIDRDSYNPDSIALLKQQGIDFQRNKEEGIDSWEFAKLLLKSELVFNPPVTWVTFHSAYDFGFLIKALTQKNLPSDADEFMWLVSVYFGVEVYDLKYMMTFCNGLYGGLERVANTLEVDRMVGKSHQAGSDSLLTMQTYMKLKDTLFNSRTEIAHGMTNVLFGLESSKCNLINVLL